MPVIRTPRGRIQVTLRYRTPRGFIFSPGEEYEYYSIVERRECKCNGTNGKLLYKLYKTNRGLIPTVKAIIL